jgi:hypothetical protein
MAKAMYTMPMPEKPAKTSGWRYAGMEGAMMDADSFWMHGLLIFFIGWSPDNRYVALGSFDSTVQVWRGL